MIYPSSFTTLAVAEKALRDIDGELSVLVPPTEEQIDLFSVEVEELRRSILNLVVRINKNDTFLKTIA